MGIKFKDIIREFKGKTDDIEFTGYSAKLKEDHVFHYNIKNKITGVSKIDGDLIYNLDNKTGTITTISRIDENTIYHFKRKLTAPNEYVQVGEAIGSSLIERIEEEDAYLIRHLDPEGKVTGCSYTKYFPLPISGVMIHARYKENNG